MEQIIYIKMDLALDNLQRLICHKTKQTKPKPCGPKSDLNDFLLERRKGIFHAFNT